MMPTHWTRRTVLVTVLLGVITTAAWATPPDSADEQAGGADASMRVIDARYVEISVGAGGKRYCWLELSGNPLIHRYVLGEVHGNDYVLTNMGDKAPDPPKLIVRLDGKLAPATVPRWRIAAAAKVGQVLWLCVAPVPRPRITLYIGKPPHPSWEISGGDPYEGGVVRVDLASGKSERWTSENGLPDALVCHDGQEVVLASGHASWGPVAGEIRAEDGKVVFTTAYGSRVACDPAGREWPVLHDGEPAALVAILRQWKADPRAVWAMERAEVIHCKEAVPHLVAALGGCHELDHEAMVSMALAAKDALIAIGDASCAEALRKIVEGPNRIAANCASAAAQHLTVPFSEPVAGLAVRLVTQEAFPMLGCGSGVEVQVRNMSDHPLAFYYNKQHQDSSHLAGDIRSEDGSATELPARKDRHVRREVLEPGQVVTLYRLLEPRPAGRYVVRFRIDIPEAAAREWQKTDDKSPIKIWSGSMETNEATLRWRPESETAEPAGRAEPLPYGHEIYRLYADGKPAQARAALKALVTRDLMAIQSLRPHKADELELMYGFALTADVVRKCIETEEKLAVDTRAAELVSLAGAVIAVLNTLPTELSMHKDTPAYERLKRQREFASEKKAQLLAAAVTAALRKAGKAEEADAFAARHAAPRRMAGGEKQAEGTHDPEAVRDPQVSEFLEKIKNAPDPVAVAVAAAQDKGDSDWFATGLALAGMDVLVEHWDDPRSEAALDEIARSGPHIGRGLLSYAGEAAERLAKVRAWKTYTRLLGDAVAPEQKVARIRTILKEGLYRPAEPGRDAKVAGALLKLLVHQAVAYGGGTVIDLIFEWGNGRPCIREYLRAYPQESIDFVKRVGMEKVVAKGDFFHALVAADLDEALLPVLESWLPELKTDEQTQQVVWALGVLPGGEQRLHKLLDDPRLSVVKWAASTMANTYRSQANLEAIVTARDRLSKAGATDRELGFTDLTIKHLREYLEEKAKASARQPDGASRPAVEESKPLVTTDGTPGRNGECECTC